MPGIWHRVQRISDHAGCSAFPFFPDAAIGQKAIRVKRGNKSIQFDDAVDGADPGITERYFCTGEKRTCGQHTGGLKGPDRWQRPGRPGWYLLWTAERGQKE